VKKVNILLLLLVCVGVMPVFFVGCKGGYSDEWLYNEHVATVYVEMFDNRTFRRGLEYTLTDALVKQIEAQTPYKVVSDRSIADSVLSGTVVDISESVLSGERETGLPLEKLDQATAQVSWKNLRSGEYIVTDMQVKASASYSEFQDQKLEYANDVTANKLAERIVEMMQLDWE
jgi:hypothetical protein